MVVPITPASNPAVVSQLQILINELTSNTDMGAFTGSETGSLGEKLQNIQDTIDAITGGASGLKTSGGGYYLIPAGPGEGIVIDSSFSANAYDNWVQLRSASGNAIFIVGVEIEPKIVSAGIYLQFDLGVGSAAAEVSIGELKVGQKGNAGEGQWYFPLPFPIPVASNTRIALRVADAAGSSSNHQWTLVVINQTDLVDV